MRDTGGEHRRGGRCLLSPVPVQQVGFHRLWQLQLFDALLQVRPADLLADDAPAQVHQWQWFGWKRRKTLESINILRFVRVNFQSMVKIGKSSNTAQTSKRGVTQRTFLNSTTIKITAIMKRALALQTPKQKVLNRKVTTITSTFPSTSSKGSPEKKIRQIFAIIHNKPSAVALTTAREKLFLAQHFRGRLQSESGSRQCSNNLFYCVIVVQKTKIGETASGPRSRRL